MNIHVLTLFGEMIEGFVSHGLLGQACASGVVTVTTGDFRNNAPAPHHQVDDSPYGGGPGMVLKPEPIFDYVEANEVPRPIVYLTPSGQPFTQSKAAEMAHLDGFTLLCGRYEGLDQRVRDQLVDDEISVGDYVLAGGEVAAMVVIEAVTRLVPDVMGNPQSYLSESFSEGLLEYPQYTRPANHNGLSVPEELLSGDHGMIARFRKAKSLELTARLRPDLIEQRGGFTIEDREILDEFNLEV